MKSSRKILTASIFILFLLSGLTSCGNLLLKAGPKDQPEKINPEKTYNLEGRISTEGALPSRLIRSAHTSVTFNTTNYDFYVQATANNNTITGTVKEDNSFSISGLSYNTDYTITAYATIKDDTDKMVLYGEYEEVINVSSENTYKTLDNNLFLFPLRTEAGGHIELPIISECSNIKKVEIWVNLNTDEEDPNHHFLEFPEYQENQDNQVTLELDLPGSSYLVSMNFYGGLEEDFFLLYHCDEMVNVFDYLTTDTWLKNGDEKHLTVDAETGKTSFIVNSDCLDYFAMNTYYVDSSISVDDSTWRGSQTNPIPRLDYALGKAINFDTEDEITIFIKDGLNEEINPISLNKNLKIIAYKNTPYDNGGSAELKLKSSSPMITVSEGKTLTLNGISFTNGTDSSGTYIDIEEDAEAELTRCSFDDGNVSSEGAICNNGTLTLAGCSFSHDTANDDESPNDVYCGAASTTKLGAGNTFSGVIGLAYDEDNLAKVTLTGAQENTVVLKPERYIPFKEILLAGENVSLEENADFFSLADTCYKIDTSGQIRANVPENALYVASGYPETYGESDGSFERPYKTILDAYKQVNDDCNTIWVYSGLSEDWGNDGNDEEFTLDRNVTVKVWDTHEGSELSCKNEGSADINLKNEIVFDENKTFSFNNIAFSDIDSGYLSIKGANVTFTNCTFTHKGFEILNCEQGTICLDNCKVKATNEVSEAWCVVNLKHVDLTLKGNTQFDEKSSMGIIGPGIENFGKCPYIHADGLTDGRVCSIELIYGIAPGDHIFDDCYTRNRFPIIENFLDLTINDSNSRINGTVYYNTSQMPVGIYVDSNSNYSGEQTGDYDKPYKSLEAALVKACEETDDVVIRIREGSEYTWTEPLELTHSNKITVQPYMTSIPDETGNPGSTIIHYKENSVLNLSSGEFIAENLYFSRDDTNSSSSFIYNSGATVTLKGCTFTNGRCTTGAVQNNSTMTIKGCTFDKNIYVNETEKTYGYAIWCTPSSRTNYYDNEFTDNTPQYIKLGESSNTAKLNIPYPLTRYVTVVTDIYPWQSPELAYFSESDVTSGRFILVKSSIEEFGTEYTIDGYDNVGIPVRTLFVDKSQSDNGSGAHDNPYKSLGSALQNTSEGERTLIYLKYSEGADVISTDLSVKEKTYLIPYEFPDELTEESRYYSVELQNNQPITVSKSKIIAEHISFTHSGQNSTGNGGIINIASGASADFTDCKFKNGTADYGGAIYNEGSVTLTSCIFKSNSSVSAGNSLYSTHYAMIDNCQFNDNNIAVSTIFLNKNLYLYNSFGLSSNEYIEIASEEGASPEITLQSGFSTESSIKLKIEYDYNLNEKRVFNQRATGEAKNSFTPYNYRATFSIDNDGKIISNGLGGTITVPVNLYDVLEINYDNIDSGYKFTLYDKNGSTVTNNNASISISHVELSGETVQSESVSLIMSSDFWMLTLPEESGAYHIYLKIDYRLNDNSVKTYYADFFIEK